MLKMAPINKYDYLVVGAGLSGATFAQQMFEAGKSVLVIDKRQHVAGNAYTYTVENIDVHEYGPHLFHTNSLDLWQYVQRFADFNDYHHIVMAQTSQGLLSLPISLMTLNQLYGIKTPAQAHRYLDSVREHVEGNDVESWCLRNIGRELYTLFIQDYTIKQWDMLPTQLPESIVRRLPIRFDYNTHYFSDRYQGIPIDGYTQLVWNMLDGIDVRLGVEYQRGDFLNIAKKIVYTGALDSLYSYKYGILPYRSIRVEHEHVIKPEYVFGSGQTNFTDFSQPYTRIIEPKHFTGVKSNLTVLTREYSIKDGEPYYPINTVENNRIAALYMQEARKEGYILTGRLATYRYLDMHQAIAQSLSVARNELYGY